MKTIIYNLIIDESGSMIDSKKSTLESINHQLDTIKKLAIKHEGQIQYFVSLSTFNDSIKQRFHARQVEKLDQYKWMNYSPYGSTALLDAIGYSIAQVKINAKKINGKGVEVVMVILTDGYENSSKDFSLTKISKKIRKLEDNGQWKFIFLGADIDVFNTINSLNIKSLNSIEFRKEKFNEVNNSIEKALINHSELLKSSNKTEDFFKVLHKPNQSQDLILKIK
jgi:hypothetical protein